jgi:hypothetical protein
MILFVVYIHATLSFHENKIGGTKVLQAGYNNLKEHSKKSVIYLHNTKSRESNSIKI